MVVSRLLTWLRRLGPARAGGADSTCEPLAGPAVADLPELASSPCLMGEVDRAYMGLQDEREPAADQGLPTVIR